MSIGYKASINGKCRNIVYEVGKTYTFKGEMKLEKRGFHFCEEMGSLLNFYPIGKNTKVFEIEVLGDVINDGINNVTNKFKVLREIENHLVVNSRNGVYKYDYNENLVEQFESGHSRIYKYDDNGNLIEKFDTWNNVVSWLKYKFDDNNNVIEGMNSGGDWIKYRYNDRHHLIGGASSALYWFKYECDEKGNVISYEDHNDIRYSIEIE